MMSRRDSGRIGSSQGEGSFMSVYGTGSDKLGMGRVRKAVSSSEFAPGCMIYLMRGI